MKKALRNPSSTHRDIREYLYACHYDYWKTITCYTPFMHNVREPQAAIDFVSEVEIIRSVPGFNVETIFECDIVTNEDGSVSIECPELCVYSTGDSREEAVENMKANIASLYEELNEDDALSSDWLEIRKKLNKQLKQ